MRMLSHPGVIWRGVSHQRAVQLVERGGKRPVGNVVAVAVHAIRRSRRRRLRVRSAVTAPAFAHRRQRHVRDLIGADDAVAIATRWLPLGIPAMFWNYVIERAPRKILGRAQITICTFKARHPINQRLCSMRLHEGVAAVTESALLKDAAD